MKDQLRTVSSDNQAEHFINEEISGHIKLYLNPQIKFMNYEKKIISEFYLRMP